MKYEYGFDPDAQNNTAASIYVMARRGGKRILDIGSGPAIVSSVLARADNCTVTCLDYDREALNAAAAAGVHRTLEVDLDSKTWHAGLEGERFDTVILADVLEHVRRPDLLLADLRHKDLLDDPAMLVISIPNANHQAVLAELFSGDFRYTETGLLDSTHIRWFTLDSITRLLESNGFLVTEIRRTLRTLEQTTHSFRALGLAESARQAISDLGLEGRTYQYVLTARPTTQAARLSALHDQMQSAHEQADASDKAVRALGRQLADTRALLTAERRHMLKEAASGAGELAAKEKEVAGLRQQLKRAENRLQKRNQEVAKARRPSGPAAILRKGVSRMLGPRARPAVQFGRRVERKLKRVLAARRTDAT